MYSYPAVTFDSSITTITLVAAAGLTNYHHPPISSLLDPKVEASGIHLLPESITSSDPTVGSPVSIPSRAWLGPHPRFFPICLLSESIPMCLFDQQPQHAHRLSLSSAGAGSCLPFSLLAMSHTLLGPFDPLPSARKFWAWVQMDPSHPWVQPPAWVLTSEV